MGDVPPLLLFLLLALMLCSPVLAGRVPVASNTLALWAPWSQFPHQPIRNSTIADSALLYLPWNVFERNSLAAGEWPLWNPFNFAGASFAANSQNQLYYPLTWIMWLLPLTAGIQALALFNIFFAGAGIYFLCRHFGTSRLAATIAGLGFAGSGMLQLALELPGVAVPYGWLPWMLLALDNALDTRSPRWIALTALVCGLQLVSGNLQWCIYSYFALALWIAWRSGAAAIKAQWRSVAGTLLAGVLALTGGIAIAAVHLAPVLELTGLSTRAETRVSSKSGPIYDLLRLLMPSYFGTSAGDVGAPLVFGDLWYVGIGLLILSGLALLLPGRAEKWLWAGLALFSVCVTYGIGPFLYVRWLPGLSGLVPSRIGYLFIFSVCLLAAFGLDAWLAASAGRTRRAVVALEVVLAVPALALAAAQLLAAGSTNQDLLALQREQVIRTISLAGSFGVVLALPLVVAAPRARPALRVTGNVRRAATTTCILVIMLADVATVAPGYNTFVEPGDLLPKSPAVAWLQSQPAGGRIMGLGVNTTLPTFVPNSDLLYGLQSVAGYDSLHTARYEDFWASVDPSVRPVNTSTPYANVFVRPQVYSSTLADLLNVRYVASASRLVPPPNLRAVYTGEITIYENPSAMPRAFVVDSAEVLPQSDVLGRLADPGFDPSKTVLLEAESSPPSLPASNPSSGPPGTAQVIHYGLNSVDLDVSMSRPGWVVLADQNYPGWSATVDGASRPLFTADYLLRSVHIDAGRHHVTFSFLPTNYWLYLGITLAALAVAIVLALGNGRPFVIN
jgi:hypothetical protein